MTATATQSAAEQTDEALSKLEAKLEAKPRLDVWVLARFIGARLHIEGVTDNLKRAEGWRDQTHDSRITGPFEVTS